MRHDPLLSWAYTPEQIALLLILEKLTKDQMLDVLALVKELLESLSSDESKETTRQATINKQLAELALRFNRMTQRPAWIRASGATKATASYAEQVLLSPELVGALAVLAPASREAFFERARNAAAVGADFNDPKCSDWLPRSAEALLLIDALEERSRRPAPQEDLPADITSDELHLLKLLRTLSDESRDRVVSRAIGYAGGELANGKGR